MFFKHHLLFKNIEKIKIQGDKLQLVDLENSSTFEYVNC